MANAENAGFKDELKTTGGTLCGFMFGELTMAEGKPHFANLMMTKLCGGIAK